MGGDVGELDGSGEGSKRARRCKSRMRVVTWMCGEILTEHGRSPSGCYTHHNLELAAVHGTSFGLGARLAQNKNSSSPSRAETGPLQTHILRRGVELVRNGDARPLNLRSAQCTGEKNNCRFTNFRYSYM